MLRRSVLVVPLLAAVAALVGVASARRPLHAALLGALVGIVGAALLFALSERRIAEVADAIARFGGGETRVRVDDRGSEQWRRMARALNAVAASLEQRVQQLEAERERVARLLDDLPPAILLFAADRLAYANRPARELFGLATIDERRSPLQLLGSEAMVDAISEARETGRIVEVDVARAGRSLVARAAPTGEEVALVVTDLTDVQRLEAMRRDFVTNASHELKTPVAGIQALAESLSVAVRRDPARAGRMVALLEREAARLAQLVRDLLDLSRVEEAPDPGRRVRVDVSAVVAAEVERLSALAQGRNVRIRTHLAPDAAVVAVPEDLRLVVANLLENAVRYNRDGGEVVVRTARVDARIVLQVVDTGIGIPDGERDRIFERFYRIDRARSRAVGGTGLGLSIVRHATERNGGSVTMSSVLGEGSTFTVSLPIEGLHT